MRTSVFLVILFLIISSGTDSWGASATSGRTENITKVENQGQLPEVKINNVGNITPGEDQTLLEYFLGDTTLFIFVIKVESYAVKEVPIDSVFQMNLTKMTRAGIYGYYNAPPSRRSQRAKSRALRNYVEASGELYEKLILPVKDQLTRKLIIVPDGRLGYIPFEALLTGPPLDAEDPGTFRYLLEDHQVSYAYSATLLKEMREKKHQRVPSGNVLAMAPFYDENADGLPGKRAISAKGDVPQDTLPFLPATGEEAAAISNSFGGTAYYGGEADLVTFRREAPGYRILHLSTHGLADDRVGDYAFLAFGVPDQPGAFAKLYARDLYNISLNADMVVLSACETGVGELKKGEGIISLARAFAYAGAKSIFTTLWSVDDKTTKDICVSFYQHLNMGKTKDVALRQAKLDFLAANADDKERLHPFYWAGMIGIGDMRPIVIK